MDNQQRNYRVYIASDGLRYYIGCQSNSSPDYLGSFSDKSFKPIYKFIVGHFESREEAGDYEIELIQSLDAIKDHLFVNKAILPVKSIEDCRNYALKLYEDRPELKQVISEKSKDLWQDPNYVTLQADAKIRLSRRMKELWQDPQFRDSQINKLKKASETRMWHSDESIERHLNGSKKGAQASKKFFETLKKDPDAYEEYMKERGKKISEAKRKKNTSND